MVLDDIGKTCAFVEVGEATGDDGIAEVGDAADLGGVTEVGGTYASIYEGGTTVEETGAAKEPDVRLKVFASENEGVPEDIT